MFFGKSLQSSAQFLSEKNEGVAFLTKCQAPKNTGVSTNEEATKGYSRLFMISPYLRPFVITLTKTVLGTHYIMDKIETLLLLVVIFYFHP